MSLQDQLYTYSPSDVTIFMAGIIVDPGWRGDQEFLSIRPGGPMFTLKRGVGGGATRTKTGDRSATANITMLAGSPGHALFQALFQSDIDTPNGNGAILPLVVKDPITTREIHTFASAWIVQWPDVVKSNDSQPLIWQVATHLWIPNF